MTETVPQSTRDLRGATQVSQAPTMQAQGAPIEGPPEARDPANNAPKTVHLCSEEGGAITGQVIGISGWQMTLYGARRVTKSIHKNGRWTLDELDQLLPISLAQGLTNPMPPAPPRE